MLEKSERMSRTMMESQRMGGRRISGIFFDVIVRPAASFQAGVVVSKKVSPASVDRHRIKRRIMHALRDSGMTTMSIHIFIFTKNTVMTASYAHIVGACQEVMHKIMMSRAA